MITPLSNTHHSSRHTVDTWRTAPKPVSLINSDNTTDTVDNLPPKDAAFSSLAYQLSDSANRADTAYAVLTREELGEQASTLLKKITGTTYDASRAARHAETPDSSDPERVARAAEATAFVSGNGKNPFAGLSRESLALITYDDSGLYTTNERRAAWEESYDQEYSWRKEVVAQAMAEYDSSGKLTDFFSSVLKHYETLPAIEQAQYPDNYAAKLQKWIDLDYNYFSNTVEGKGTPEDILSLQESLDVLKH